MGETILELKGIVKAFPGVLALGGIDFDLKAGEVHAICGENGAGKSTLMKVVCGVYLPDEGTIRVNGKEETFANPVEAYEKGVSIIFQETSLFEEMTVLDEPTRSVDVNAKSEIHKIISDLTQDGLTIIMVSSELPELLGMCDRIYVMKDGTSIVGGSGDMKGTPAATLIIATLNSGLTVLNIPIATQTVVQGTVLLISLVAFVVSPNDGTAIAATLKKAAEKGIKVLTFDATNVDNYNY